MTLWKSVVQHFPLSFSLSAVVSRTMAEIFMIDDRHVELVNVTEENAEHAPDNGTAA